MTLQEAYIKAKNVAYKQGHRFFKACGDYGDFWGFMFWRADYDTEDLLNFPSGFAEVTVNKKNGDINEFTPTMDFDLFGKRKSIPIEQFADVEA